MGIEGKRLVTKLATIMADPSVGKIDKKGLNAHFNYKFVQDEDVSDAVRPLLAKNNIMLFPSVTAERRDGNLTVLNVALTFVDGDTGERETINSVGYGADTQDKGANKALTAAVKYALIKTFLIASGEDSDAAGHVEPTASAPVRTAAPKPAPAPVTDGPQEAVIEVAGVSEKAGPLENGKPKWTKYVIKSSDGLLYGTFSKSYAAEAKRAGDSGVPVLVRFTKNQYGNDIAREDGLAVIDPERAA